MQSILWIETPLFYQNQLDILPTAKRMAFRAAMSLYGVKSLVIVPEDIYSDSSEIFFFIG